MNVSCVKRLPWKRRAFTSIAEASYLLRVGRALSMGVKQPNPELRLIRINVIFEEVQNRCVQAYSFSLVSRQDGSPIFQRNFHPEKALPMKLVRQDWRRSHSRVLGIQTIKRFRVTC